MQGPKVGDLVHCRESNDRLNLCRILRITTSRFGTMFRVEHVDIKIGNSTHKAEYPEKDVAWPVLIAESRTTAGSGLHTLVLLPASR